MEKPGRKPPAATAPKNPESLVDPSGVPYVHCSPGEQKEFDLYTLGADRKEGAEGEDKDVTNW